MGTVFIAVYIFVLVSFEFEVEKKELQRGQREARWKDKVGEAAAYLSVTCGFDFSAVPMPAAGRKGGEVMGRLTVLGPRGAERGDETREALWKCHCYFDSWTVFKKRRCWPFPPLWQDKEPGRQWGEPGLGSTPRGMFWLNKQLLTMVWKLSWTASLRVAFEICSAGSESKWKQEEKTWELQVSCEFQFLMPPSHFKDKSQIWSHFYSNGMTSITLDRNNLIFVAQSSNGSYDKLKSWNESGSGIC